MIDVSQRGGRDILKPIPVLHFRMGPCVMLI